MTKRRLLAAAALAISLGVTPATQGLGAVNAEWAWGLRMNRHEALAFGLGAYVMCGAIANPGAAACSVAGLL